MNAIGTSLVRYLESNGTRAETLGIVRRLARAAGVLAEELRRTPIVSSLSSGAEGALHGSGPGTLGPLALEIYRSALADAPEAAAIATERGVEPLPGAARGNIVVTLAPFDDPGPFLANGSVGTLFGIYRAGRTGTPRELAASGYFLFGPSTLMVLSDGAAPDAFAFDEVVHDFLLVRAALTCPRAITSRHGARSGEPLVAAAHRNLLEGGVLLVPHAHVVCEAAPLAFLFEAANGEALSGSRRLLELLPAVFSDRASACFSGEATPRHIPVTVAA